MKKLLIIIGIILLSSSSIILCLSPRKKTHCCNSYTMQGLWYLLRCGCLRDCKKKDSQKSYVVALTPIIQVPVLPTNNAANTMPTYQPYLPRAKDSGVITVAVG